MKILIYSHFFAPSVGGVETVVLSLARGLADLRKPDGTPEFELTVVTATRADDFDDNVLAFRVVRQPNLLQLWSLIRSSNIVHIAGPLLWSSTMASKQSVRTASSSSRHQARPAPAISCPGVIGNVCAVTRKRDGGFPLGFGSLHL